MKLHEYQSKELLKGEGLPLPEGAAAGDAEAAFEAARRIGRPVAVKVQVQAGGRGKAGGIRLVSTPEEARETAKSFLGRPFLSLPVKKVLVEEQVRPDREFYLSVTVDRRNKRNVLLFAREGGVDIEELARTHPEAIQRYPLKPDAAPTKEELIAFFKPLGVPAPEKLSEIATRLVALYRRFDAELLEINPLAWSEKRGYVLLDAKIIIDDNALFRQPGAAGNLDELETDAVEREARKRKLAYVRLTGGNVGIIGNGAGLVMATMDEVNAAGGKPADFLDIGGGAKAEVVKNALEIVLMDENVKGIFLNIFGGITRCDEVARGILAAASTTRRRVPMVLRLAGTKAEEGRALLDGSSLIPAATMQEGARRIVEVLRS